MVDPILFSSEIVLGGAVLPCGVLLGGGGPGPRRAPGACASWRPSRAPSLSGLLGGGCAPSDEEGADQAVGCHYSRIN